LLADVFEEFNWAWTAHYVKMIAEMTNVAILLQVEDFEE
jgi:hypothetical protein